MLSQTFSSVQLKIARLLLNVAKNDASKPKKLFHSTFPRLADVNQVKGTNPN
jgi:hypothetical protein